MIDEHGQIIQTIDDRSLFLDEMLQLIDKQIERCDKYVEGWKSQMQKSLHGDMENQKYHEKNALRAL